MHKRTSTVGGRQNPSRSDPQVLGTRLKVCLLHQALHKAGQTYEYWSITHSVSDVSIELPCELTYSLDLDTSPLYHGTL